MQALTGIASTDFKPQWGHVSVLVNTTSTDIGQFS
jgi:hypothetical protein